MRRRPLEIRQPASEVVGNRREALNGEETDGRY